MTASAPSNIVDRLQLLGVTEAALRDAVHRAHLHRIRLTPNYPRNYPGLMMWAETVAGVADHLRSAGWLRQDPSGYAITVNEELQLAIAVASGDEATGVAHGNPTNRSRKGRSTEDAIEGNRQGSFLFPDELLDIAPVPKPDKHQTWVLMHHTDAMRREIRLEFSQPAAIECGKITAWTERIILNPISLDDEPTDLARFEVLDGPEIEIEVRRKA